MSKVNKSAASGATRKAASNINTSECITARSRRPADKGSLAACMASNFWRPIVQAQLERDSTGQAGVGDATDSARAGIRLCEAVLHD